MTKQDMVKTKGQITWGKADISGESAIQQECCHFWVIDSASGPISQGTCQICGMKKDFDNYLTDCLKSNK